MKKYTRRLLSMALSVALCLSLCIPAMAAVYEGYPDLTFTATLDKAELNYSATEDQTIVLTLAPSQTIQTGSITYKISVPDGLTLTSISSNKFTDIASYASVGNKSVNWFTMGDDYTDVTELGLLTFTVPAGTSAGEYPISIYSLELTNWGATYPAGRGAASTTLTIVDPDAPATSGYTVAIADTTEGTDEVNPGDTVTMNATVSGADYNGMQATVKYNANLFTYVSGGSNNVVNGIDGTVDVECFETTTREAGSVAATLTFTVKSDVTETATGEFTLTAAKAGTFTDASGAVNAPEANKTGDSVTVQVAETPAATYNVELGTGLTGETSATQGTDYTATITGYDADLNNYDVTVTIGDVEYTGFTQSNGTITIPGEDITGAIAITVTKTDKYTVGIKANYVTGWSLVTVTGSHGGYRYGDNNMIKVVAYAVNGDPTYAWLVEGAVTENTVRNAVTTSDYTTAITAKDYDVNKSGTVDFYDALAAFGCYNIVADYPVGNYVELYLRCDVNGNKKCDAVDFSLVMSNYTK